MATEKKVNNFDVLKTMGERNGKIWMTPLSNIGNMKKTKRGTLLEIGVGMDVIQGIMMGEYVGGLVLADKAEFLAVAEELKELEELKNERKDE